MPNRLARVASPGKFLLPLNIGACWEEELFMNIVGILPIFPRVQIGGKRKFHEIWEFCLCYKGSFGYSFREGRL